MLLWIYKKNVRMDVALWCYKWNGYRNFCGGVSIENLTVLIKRNLQMDVAPWCYKWTDGMRYRAPSVQKVTKKLRL